jgi:hypothetical protein
MSGCVVSAAHTNATTVRARTALTEELGDRFMFVL